MFVHLTTHQLGKLLNEAAEIGAESALSVLGEKPKHITQNQAYQKYKRGRVERWVKWGWVKPMPVGEGDKPMLHYSVVELEMANAKSAYENSTDHIKDVTNIQP